MADQATIVGLGEALFDVFAPGDERLGGAPLNVAVHAHQLGNTGVAASRIGEDERGARVAAALDARGMTTAHLQRDPDRPTGVVTVTMHGGQPEYTIEPGAAWDALHYDDDLAALAGVCEAVCFGTLAQREAMTREAIADFLDDAPQAVRLFDVNLRQRYYDRALLEASARRATAIKLNDEELAVLRDLLELGGDDEATAAAALRERCGLEWVALTRGARGVAVFDAEGMHEAGPVEADVARGDAVGAGDSVSAALLHGVVRGWAWDRTLTLANAIGAHVASERGACPPLSERVLALAAG